MGPINSAPGTGFLFFFESEVTLGKCASLEWVIDYNPLHASTMTDSHLHRSHFNLKAYRTAFTLHTDVFWISRGFPTRLQTSLTRPMRQTSQTAVDEILKAWRNRDDAEVFASHLDRALEQVAFLGQYFLRAREEEVISSNDYVAFTARLGTIDGHIRRLPHFARVPYS